VTPRVQVYDDEAGVTGGEFIRVEPKPVQAPGSITTDNDIGFFEQLVQNTGGIRSGQVQGGAAFAQQGVSHRSWTHVRMAGRIDTQHVCAECAQKTRADRPGNDPRHVEDPHPHHRKLRPGAAPSRLGVAKDVTPNQCFAHHGSALLVPPPLSFISDGSGNTPCRKDPFFQDLAWNGPDGETDRIRVLAAAQCVEECCFVPRVIGVAPKPPVGGRPESG
jgi:hypothetical protein